MKEEATVTNFTSSFFKKKGILLFVGVVLFILYVSICELKSWVERLMYVKDSVSVTD